MENDVDAFVGTKDLMEWTMTSMLLSGQRCDGVDSDVNTSVGTKGLMEWIMTSMLLSGRRV